jgi:hypothetical protein
MAATAKWDHGARYTAGYLDTSSRTPAALRRYLVCRYHCIFPYPCRYAGHLCDPSHISISESPLRRVTALSRHGMAASSLLRPVNLENEPVFAVGGCPLPSQLGREY